MAKTTNRGTIIARSRQKSEYFPRPGFGPMAGDLGGEYGHARDL